jgi:hypothetical protein
MGFDLSGKAPKSEDGRYFSANLAGWHPIVDICMRVAPNICARCEHWRTNDGDGLEDDDALALADALQKAVDTGALDYEDALSGQESAALRKQMLTLRVANGQLLAFAAPELLPSGKPELIVMVLEFIAFLRDSGGFEIW